MKENGRNRLLKILKRVFIIAVLVVLVFLVSAFFLGKVYEDKIEKLVITEINKNLEARVNVGDISFSVLKDFPFATLQFKDVIIVKNEKRENDTLLHAGSLFLNFNIIDLIRKNYILKHIAIKDASLNLQVYSDDTDNFHLFKTREDTVQSSFSLNLNRVNLNNVQIIYVNDLSDQDYSIIAKDIFLKGLFSETNYSLKIDGDVLIRHLFSGRNQYLSDQDAHLEIDLNVDEVNKIYSLEKGKIHFDDLYFYVDGSVKHNEKDNDINLEITGQDQDLSSFIQKLPEEYKSQFNNITAKGRFFANAGISGKFGREMNPHLNVEFGFERGKIIHNKTSVSLDDVSFEGSFNNGTNNSPESSIIMINNFSAGLRKGIIKGSFELSDLIKPQISFVADCELDLGDLQDFIELDTIKSINGKLEIKISYKGKLKSIEDLNPKDLISSTTSGQMIIHDMSCQLKGDDKIYSNINADMSFNNNDLLVNRLDLRVSGSDFMIQGYFRNFLPFIFIQDENLLVEAELNSSEVKLDKLLARDPGNIDKGYELHFSEKVEFDIAINIEKLSFQKFQAENISGRLIMDDKILNVSSLYFQAEDGVTRAAGQIDGTKSDKLFIYCDASIRDVNIKKLFYEFGNFGQTGLTDENIRGIVDANIEFSGMWTSSFKVDPSSIYTKADLIIENGALIDYPPLMSLSDHIKDADLTKVNFSTLQNQIEIKDKQINIPEMEIESDAIDISASGTHKFNNEINYHLKVLWSELRSRKSKDEEGEFGVVIDDGLQKNTLFFVITGTLDDPVIKYDKKGLKDKIVSDLKKEKKKLKEIFREEFSGKDSIKEIEKQRIKKQEEGEFIIEWEENEPDNQKKEVKTKKNKNPEIYIEWDDEEDENDTLKKK